MHISFFALPAAAIGALLTMLALVSPVHGVTPSPESDWGAEHRSEAQGAQRK